MNISGVLISLFPWLTLPLPRQIFIIRTSCLFSLYSQFLLTNSILWGCSLNSDSHRNYKNIFLWAVWLRVTAKWPVRSNGLYYGRFSVCSCISNTRVIFRDTGSVPKEITFCQLTKWPVRSNSVCTLVDLACPLVFSNTRVIFFVTGSVPEEITFCKLAVDVYTKELYIIELEILKAMAYRELILNWELP